MVPMTTSHAPAKIPRTTIELIGRGNYDHFGERARRSREDAPATIGQFLWLIANAVLIAVYRNLIQAKRLLATRTANELHQSGFAVISSHALNSLCSRRLYSRLARNRLIIVAGTPLVARRT